MSTINVLICNRFGAVEDTALVLKRLHELGQNLPKGFRISGGQRKFVVLKENFKSKNIVLAIGPEQEVRRIYHKHLVEWIESQVKGLHVFGGGSVTFNCDGRFDALDSRKDEKATRQNWRATFGGYSGDYGPFDLALVYVKEQLREILQMKVSFEIQR